MGYREYMVREEPVSPGLPPVVRWMLWLNAGIYLAQHFLWPREFAALEPYLALSRRGLLAGYLWQPLTYMFLHANLTHVMMNMMGLYFMGPDTERTLGSRRFLYLYLLSGILGGIGFALLNARAPCIGASGAIYGVLGAFAALHPNRKVSLLLFPFVVFPAWVLVLLYGVIEFTSALSRSGGGVAHSAHLAGGIAGWIFARTLSSRPIRWRQLWSRRVRRSDRPAAAPDEGDVDRILEKISVKGLHSLSSRERETLDRASRLRTNRI